MPPIVTVLLRTISLFSAGSPEASSVWKSAAREIFRQFFCNELPIEEVSS